jgi:phenylacetate-CoA ligase
MMHSIVQPIHRAYRWVRPGTRPAVSFFWQGLAFRNQTNAWSADRKREWMLKRLREVVRGAASETPYYRQRFAAEGFDPAADFSFDDFARLPVLEREDIRNAGEHLVSHAVPADQIRKDATGGSTGIPTEIRTGPRERGWRESGMEYFMRRIGLPAGTRTALLWGHHLDPIERDSLRDRAREWLVNVRPFDCLRLSPDVLMRYHREMEQMRPKCIVAYASSLAALAEFLDEQGLAPGYPTSRMVTGAEKLLPHHREIVERVFKRPVHERYGGRDVSLIGFQTHVPERLDFDLDWSALLVEPETDEERTSILITKLQADAMPMIRYRVGDIGAFPAGSRPGHPSFTLASVVGRETDRILLPSGGWMDGLSFPHMMKNYPVREFQIYQRADYSVTVRVIPAAAFGDDSAREILHIVRANLPNVPVDLQRVAEIPRTKSNKRKPVISEVSA